MRQRERLDAFLDRNGLDAVWFARPNYFAWVTGGSNVVDAASDVGVAATGYTGDRLRVVTNNIEADRLADEELPDDAVVDTSPWHGRTSRPRSSTEVRRPPRPTSTSPSTTPSRPTSDRVTGSDDRFGADILDGATGPPDN